MNIVILNPALQNNQGVVSHNLGDVIIVNCILEQLLQLFPQASIEHFSTHCYFPLSSQKRLKAADKIFVAGTNLLSSNMAIYNQWKINVLSPHLNALHKAVLVGVGWWRYQVSPGYYTKSLLRQVLSNTQMHSVRDNYTQQKLLECGIENVVNTTCPSLWGFFDGRYPSFKVQKSDSVLTMLTDYNKHPNEDRALLNLLQQHYSNIYIWPQGKKDLSYIQHLNTEAKILPRTVDSLDSFCQNEDFDYVGTRLHGGIYCLQRGKRSLILAIDNRALEIGRDTNLPCIPRDKCHDISNWIENPAPVQLKSYKEAIDKWKMALSSD